MTDREILELNGWIIECESPYEIRHSDGSFASQQAANIVTSFLKDEFEGSGSTDEERKDYLFGK